MRWLIVSILAAAGCIRAEDPRDTGGGHDAGCAGACNGNVGNSIGDAFEGFAFTSCDGTEEVTQASLPAGRPLLFNVSTGWCGPCREETPRFEAFYEQHPDQVSIVQVLYQDNSSNPPGPTFCDEWVHSFGAPLTYTVLIDPGGAAAGYFDNPSAQMPLNLVVDPDGCVASRWVGTPPPGEPETTLDGLL
jgi:hypothetical protein